MKFGTAWGRVADVAERMAERLEGHLLAQQRLELRESHYDRVEIKRVWRRQPHPCAARRTSSQGRSLFVDPSRMTKLPGSTTGASCVLTRLSERRPFSSAKNLDRPSSVSKMGKASFAVSSRANLFRMAIDIQAGIALGFTGCQLVRPESRVTAIAKPADTGNLNHRNALPFYVQ